MINKIVITAAATMLVALPLFASADTLTRYLSVGMSGSDVSSLQTFLAQDSTIYPQGLVTGYFGFLTKSAVSNFQSRNGIDTVGRVGPITLAALNLQMNASAGADIYSPTISSISVSSSATSVTAQWNTSEPSRGILYYSTSPITMTDVLLNDVSVSGASATTDNTLRNSQSITATGLQPNTIYYYVLYSKDASGNAVVTVPATFTTKS